MSGYDYECPYCGKEFLDNDRQANDGDVEFRAFCDECEKWFSVRVTIVLEYDSYVKEKK